MSIFDRFRLDGKRLFITGGSRGLGREMALAIADAGADVVLVGRDAASLEKTAADIRALGRQAWPIQADVGMPGECERACRARSALGPIDILINNVGGRRVNVPTEDDAAGKLAADDGPESDQHVPLHQADRRGDDDARQGGRVINIASINGLVANRGIAGRHYETAKAAVIQFTRASAADWAPHGVTVNAILPGGFMTEPNQRWARESPT